MAWLRRFLELAKKPGPWRKALILAGLSDALSFGLEFFSLGLAEPIQVGVDLLTAFGLWALLGFRWGLLAGLVVEAVPGLAVFPTWLLAVGAMMALEKEGSSDAGDAKNI